MNRNYSRVLSLAALLAAVPGFNLGAAGQAAGLGSAVAAWHSDQAPIVDRRRRPRPRRGRAGRLRLPRTPLRRASYWAVAVAGSSASSRMARRP